MATSSTITSPTTALTSSATATTSLHTTASIISLHAAASYTLPTLLVILLGIEIVQPLIIKIATAIVNGVPEVFRPISQPIILTTYIGLLCRACSTIRITQMIYTIEMLSHSSVISSVNISIISKVSVITIVDIIASIHSRIPPISVIEKPI